MKIFLFIFDIYKANSTVEFVIEGTAFHKYFTTLSNNLTRCCQDKEEFINLIKFLK